MQWFVRCSNVVVHVVQRDVEPHSKMFETGHCPPLLDFLLFLLWLPCPFYLVNVKYCYHY